MKTPAIRILAACTLTAMATHAATIDEWDMNGNGLWQNSHNGINLGGHYASNYQAVAQVADDETFNFSPATLGSKFGAKSALSSTIDLTAGVTKLSWTYTSMDWATAPANNTKVGFRLWNSAGTDYVSLEFADNNDTIWAYAKSSASLGSINMQGGRLINSLADSTTPRTVELEIDYANSEIRISCAEGWQWSSAGADAVFSQTIDLAGAGITDLGKFQTYYANWSAGDITVFDNLRVETIEPINTTDVYIADTAAFSVGLALTTNSMAFSAQEGDVMVVLASSNKGSIPTTNSVAFSGTASIGPVSYDKRSAGASAHYWYTEVLTNGTLDVEMITDGAYISAAAYLLRAPEGEAVILLDTAKAGAASVTSVTNTYNLGSISSGLFLEAVSSYGASSTPLNPDTVVDISASTKRSVAHGTFTDTDSLENIWTNTLENTAIIGLVFDSVPSEAGMEQLYTEWIAAYDVGDQTAMDDDFDGDQLDNLLEYAWGGDPSDGASQGNVPEGGDLSNVGGTNYISYIYYERDDAATRGLTSIFEVGTSLIYTNWADATGYETGRGPAAAAGFTAITNQIPIDAENERFLHLQIEFAP
jgi:hypothetical protein